MQIAILFAALVSASPTTEPVDRQPAEIHVLAASSLRETIGAIAAGFEKRTGTKVLVEFEATSTLARQIKAGAPADVFISADLEWMDAVAPLERYNWLGNTLVCVAPKGGTSNCKDSATLVLGAEQVPVGKYAKAALENIGARKDRRVVYGSNVRDVLRKVVEGAGEAGVVYQTDAAVEPGVTVTYVFPASSHPPIIYPAGLLTERGRTFWKALREPGALSIAKEKGFSIP